MGSLDQHCSSSSFTWSIHTIWMPDIILRDDTQAMVDPMVQPVLGVFSWLPWVLFTRESWCSVVPRHSMAWLYLFPFKREHTRLLSYPRFPEIGNEYCIPGRAMSCTPQSLLSKKSEMRWRSGHLYSQTPLPFWWAMVYFGYFGCIAIGSRAAAEPLVHFLVLHETMHVQFHCVIIKRLWLKRKKYFFPYKCLRLST